MKLTKKKVDARIKKLKKGGWYLFCDTPEKGEEPEWYGRFLEKVYEDRIGNIGYFTYTLNPNGSKNTFGGVYEYCVPYPELPKVKLK